MDIHSSFKICSICHKEKELTEFATKKSVKCGVRAECKECASEYNKKWHKENPEKVKESCKKWYKENLEKARDACEKWHKENPEKARDASEKWRKESIKNIDDSYCTKKLMEKGFKKDQITPELIEVQQLMIKTKRLCKTLQN